MSPRGKRALLAVAALPVAGVLVVLVEVQLARMGPRLDDEDGQRPQGLVVGGGPAPSIEVVWLGDSTTTGVGTDFSKSMARRSAEEIVDELDRPVRLTVLGVSGDQVHEVVDDQLADLSADADVVVVSVGANDVTHLTSRPTFRERYERLLDGVVATAPEAEVVVVGIPDMGSAPRFDQPLRWLAGARGDQLDDIVRSVARARGHLHVDLADETGPTFRRDPGRYFSGDDFHPNDAGHALWTRAIRGELVVAARRASA